ncbi:MAG: glutathione S-transferase family protein [Deltaproteobacteria bacterium]|nr:glutathione S-transferase family protein [Deltaproteobacteria bacterium]MBW2447296.1 glutathione S-transferase family protein [Deltaproteobacteria bacterium]
MQIADDQIRTSEVRNWKGIHLLHFSDSSCSQKVRILLREKQIPWESHPVDLARQKHVTPWFLGINPRGVVPVLVHDGVVHVESNDILEYLDDHVPSPAEPYLPQTDHERSVARESLDLEDSLHMELRTITMGFLFPASLVAKSPKTLERYANQGAPDPKRDKEIAWWRRFAEIGIPDDEGRAAAEAFGGAFARLDARLAEAPWLLGDRISLLEIAWFISVHRLDLAGYPLERHPRLGAHYEMLRTRPAFAAEAAGAFVTGSFIRAYRAYRRLRRTTLRDVMVAA